MGQPGGGGIRLKYSNPLYLDDVAVDFPEMPIILAHPSMPWQDEAIAVAMHKPQVHIDLSGWSPKYFPPQLVHHANTLLKHKVLFGSDFPFITPERWMADFEQAGFRDDVKPLILKENAVARARARREEGPVTAMYFEDFEVGATFATAARTITESDVMTFADLSGDDNPLHVDREFSRARAVRRADRARVARALDRRGARDPDGNLQRHQPGVSRARGLAVRRRRQVRGHDPDGVDGDRDPADEQARARRRPHRAGDQEPARRGRAEGRLRAADGQPRRSRRGRRPMPGVEGRVVVVTGAGGGLGRSHALMLARNGATGRGERSRRLARRSRSRATRGRRRRGRDRRGRR